MLQEHLARYKDIYQYVYSHVLPEVYTTSEKPGFDLKSNFPILFKTYHDKQMIRQQSLAKNQGNYENEQPKEMHEHEKNLSKTSMNLATAKNKRLKTELKNDWQADAKRQKN